MWGESKHRTLRILLSLSCYQLKIDFYKLFSVRLMVTTNQKPAVGPQQKREMNINRPLQKISQIIKKAREERKEQKNYKEPGSYYKMAVNPNLPRVTI